ncbi:MAG TPA: hypothetical protein VFO40_08220, partial [Chthoniobacterales bacterium]|nr:hypothetical protein [Chthoniobacterales bacterium]
MPSAHPRALPHPPTGSHRRWLSLLPVLIAIFGLLVWKPPFVIRPLPSAKPENSASTGAPATNAAAAFVDPIWDSKIVATFTEKAVDVRILIMDEPTSALTGTETEALFRI